jgi:hypothetical protein
MKVVGRHRAALPLRLAIRIVKFVLPGEIKPLSLRLTGQS